MQERAQTIKVLVAASGSGGHLLPARFIAEALQQQSSSVIVEFLGTGKPLEQEIIGKKGFKVHAVSEMMPLRRKGVSGLVKWLMHLPKGVRNVQKLLDEIAPQLVIGVGGYASVLPVLLAWKRGIPTWIHEAEHTPGWANYLLSHVASTISTSFEDAKLPRSASVLYTGHPLRPSLAARNFQKNELHTPPRLFITGGSQGALAIDAALMELAPYLRSAQVQVKHQCRPENVAKVKEAYAQAGLEAEVYSFIQDIDEVYDWADIVLTRSGAGMVRELKVVGCPSIVVPLPNAEEQAANARNLEDHGQGIIVWEGEGFVSRLQDALQKLLSPEGYKNFLPKGQQVADANASERIAQGCVGLLGRSIPA